MVNKTTIDNNPTLMTIICNIQSMRIRINNKYKRFADFTRLQGMTADELHAEQDELIPLYNQVISN